MKNNRSEKNIFMIKQKIYALRLWFGRSFSRKIMLTLLVCMSFIIAFSSIAYYYSTIELLQNEYIKSNEQLLKEVNQSVDRYYTQLDDTTRSLYNDNSFIDNLRTHQDDYVSIAYNEQVIKSILHSDDAIQYIYFYDPYTQNLYSFSRENVSYAPYPELEQEEWYQRTLNNSHYFYITPLHMFKNYNNFGTLKDKTVFSVNRALKYYVTGEIIGMLSITYDTSYLERLCHNLESPGGYVSILDQDMLPRMTNCTDSCIPESILSHIHQTEDIHGYYKYTSAGKVRILLWDKFQDVYLLKDILFEELTKNALIVAQITLAFSVVVFIFSIAIAMYFSRSATRRLSILSKNIAEFGNGNLTINAEDYGNDEIGMLASAFNDMTDKINELINLEYKAKVLRKTAELQALQAQVKPHFINNALQALGTLGLKKGATEVYSMANALAKILRYTLKSTAELVPLRRELENMNDYLYIQKILWNDRLKVQLDTEESLEDRLVPVFILQPLVENSIKHGLDDCTEGIIKIKINAIESALSIEVTDNGRGIPDSSLIMLQEWLKDDITVSDDEHIGIRNIVSRMKFLYGESASFTIDCPANGGTHIHIILPDKEEKENV